MSCQDW